MPAVLSRLIICLLVLGGFISHAGKSYAESTITVFAAASMTDAMTQIGQAFTRHSGVNVVFSFAGTGTLARHLEAGAPADAFISADTRWMDYAVDHDAVLAETRVTIAGNSLVIVGSEEEPVLSEPLMQTELLDRLQGERLAIADPETVPAGRYAKQSFQALGFWQALAPSLAPMENVRVALASVARGETPLGVVYGSDAVVEPRVRILARLPEETHTPISYPAALTERAGDEARSFLSFLKSPEAGKILENKGFLALND